MTLLGLFAFICAGVFAAFVRDIIVIIFNIQKGTHQRLTGFFIALALLACTDLALGSADTFIDMLIGTVVGYVGYVVIGSALGNIFKR
ncbi:MAG: hypothetical protein VX730_08430 [Pseudomonadota bacterium]|nr:hypothetical protein [Pseudomonadota bacterium]